MTDERKQRISAIYASVKALTPEQKEKLLGSLNITNPENHTLSGNNQILLDRQSDMRETQTLFTVVAGFQQWKKAGRSVRKGQRGFLICVPSKKIHEVQENDAQVYFFFKTVFDVSQTEENES